MAVFTDDFNRADAADLGANWTEVGTHFAIISSNKCQCLVSNKDGFVYPTAFNPAAGMYAQLKMVTFGAVSHGFGCLLSQGSTVNNVNGYILKLQGTDYTNMQLIKAVDWSYYYTTGTLLGAAAMPSNGDIVRLECIAGVGQKVYINGVEKISTSDTTYTTGKAGLTGSSAGGAFPWYDDFEAGDWPLPGGGGGGSPFRIGSEGIWNRGMGHP